MTQNLHKNISLPCLWADQCKCTKPCKDFTPLEEPVITDKQIEKRKIAYRREFFRYAEEHEIFDN